MGFTCTKTPLKWVFVAVLLILWINMLHKKPQFHQGLPVLCDKRFTNSNITDSLQNVASSKDSFTIEFVYCVRALVWSTSP